MRGFLGNCLGLLHRRSIPVILGMMLVPALASAESINLVRSVEIPPAASRKVEGRPLLALDENGDVTIHYRNVSLTMSYNPTDLLPPPRERVVLNTSPEPTALGGFGIKVGFTF